MEDRESDESIRWKQNPETQRRAKVLSAQAAMALETLKAAAAESTDPAVREASARYQATHAAYKLLEGAPR